MNPRATKSASRHQGVRPARSIRCHLLPGGGLDKAHQLFGSELPKFVEELNEVLPA